MDNTPTLNDQLRLNAAPAELHSWISDDGSLTERLIEASKGAFEVRVLRERWQLVDDVSERELLALKSDETALVREVALCCFGEPWVYARSILPASTLVGPEKELESLRNKPLGALLFSHPNMRRGPIHLATLDSEKVAERVDVEMTGPQQETIWGRSSLFYLSDKPLLVSEYFLPALYSYWKHNR